MLRFIFVAALIYLAFQIWRFIYNVNRYSQPSPKRSRLAGVMVKDEICQTYLPEEEAIKEKIDGRVYYFCSEECRQRWRAEKKRVGLIKS